MPRINNVLHTSPHHDRPIAIDIRYETSVHQKPLVLFVHGFKGFKDWGTFNLIANEFASNGYVFVKMNFSHNGTTPETPTEFTDLDTFAQNNFTIELGDIDVVIEYLQGKNVPIPPQEYDANDLRMIGHSRGGATAILKSARDPRIKGLVSWAALSDLKSMWPEEVIRQWEKDGVFYIFNTRTNQNMPLDYQIVEDVINNRDRLDIPNAAASIKIPWLICHGTNDETLPFSMATDLKSLNENAELFMVENAGHTFGSEHPYYGSQLPNDTQLIVNKSIEFLNSNS